MVIIKGLKKRSRILRTLFKLNVEVESGIAVRANIFSFLGAGGAYGRAAVGAGEHIAVFDFFSAIFTLIHNFRLRLNLQQVYASAKKIYRRRQSRSRKKCYILYILFKIFSYIVDNNF